MTKENLINYKKFLISLSDVDKKVRDLYLQDLSRGDLQGPPVGYPSIDKSWLKYYSSDNIIRDFPQKSIYQYAHDANINNMNNVAFDIRTSNDNFKNGIKIKFSDFFAKIRKLAKASTTLGMQPNEIVPLILPNLPEARMLLYSNSIIGSTSYPISPLLPSNQLKKILEENSVKTLFIFDGFYKKYEEVLKSSKLEHIICLDGTESLPKFLKILMFSKKERVQCDDKRVISFDKFLKMSNLVKKDITPYYDKDHIAAIIGTSGTTGTPKGVCLTDANINSVAFAYKNGEYFEGKFMDALLPSIGYGISMMHYQTVDGRYVYLIPELLTKKFPDAMQKLNPDNFPGGPIHYINLANSSVELTKLKGKNLISGGASLSKFIEKQLNNVPEDYAENGIVNKDIIVRQGYGLSENTAMGSYCKKGAYKFGSIGIPIIYENVGIFKPGTDYEMEYGEEGEICISGPSMMQGYLNNLEETDLVIMMHSDGQKWIHTKDIGYMDEDGHIFMVDRIKNIFMRKGFNVHPNKISEFINSMPFVRNSAVIGFEHPDDQMVPIAFIELKDNITMSDDEIKNTLLTSCYKNLEETSIPYDFILVDELPINAGGKIDLVQIKKEVDIDFFKDSKVLKKCINFKK